LQRRPDPAGLKLAGIEPGATQYLHSGQLPQPLATAAPEATPTMSGTGPASPLSTPAVQSPTPVSSSTSTATPVNMPGGNARIFYITGYTATGSRTATGTVPHWGTVAVDSSVIPLGSTVYIQGLGVFHAEDTGGAVAGDHVDVFVNSAAEAYQLTGYRLVSFVPPRH
jgi:3D (Asp-Asp-Asp) domain-containing protein